MLVAMQDHPRTLELKDKPHTWTRGKNSISASESSTAPWALHPIAESLDFERIKWKLSESSEATLSKEVCTKAELEYKRFLTLKLLYQKKELVPSKLVDKFWHAHILDTAAYRSDCNQLFGFFLDHFPYFGIYGDDDQGNLQRAFAETKQLYEKHFGPYPDEMGNAARCKDHACHSPSSCACRVPAACK